MKQWEYKEVSLGEIKAGSQVTFDRTSLLNKEGEKAWELVSIISIGSLAIAYFKRQLSEK